ncbi:MAG: hypothetical protein GX759_02850 [Thermoanaerobacterales bacterium]|nr:hypothetical protein [Thermoanaerobacterales bacterium]
MKREVMVSLKRIGVLWLAALVPFFWDIFKLALVYLSRYLGYNFYLDGNFGGITLLFPGWSIRIFLPSLLPSIQQMNLLGDLEIGSGAFNSTWMGHTAYAAYLYLASLLTGGFLGIIKDIIRDKSLKIKLFFRYSWYYGPRFFMIYLLQHLIVTIMTLFFGMPKGGLLACLGGLVFVWTPYIIIMEDFGVIEAAVLAPVRIINNFKSSALFLFKICLFSSLVLIGINQLKAYKWLFGLGIWPFVGTCLIYSIMNFFDTKLTEERIVNRQREHLEGYGQTFNKTIILLLILLVIAGLPTFISKHRYFYFLFPWHKPAIELAGYYYQTQEGLVISSQNSFKDATLVIDYISPSKSYILKKTPSIIRGRGKLLTETKPIFFTFELTKSSEGKNVSYSLRNGGKVEATDGIWGNPVNRGMVLAINKDLSLFSGIIFDKSNYPDFDTLWSNKRDSIFLGPVERMPHLCGFYAGRQIPETAVEFQWEYNKALDIAFEWEEDPTQFMDRLNLAFATLDLDLLLDLLYYVSDIKPDNALEIISDKFQLMRSYMLAEGVTNWQKNVHPEVDLYQINTNKAIIVGNYYYMHEVLGFKAELFKIGAKWKITKIHITTDK